MRIRPLVLLALACTGATLAACGTGRIGGAGDEQNPPSVSGPLCTGGIADPGPAPIRRLTRFEYNATVRDLLGDTTEPAKNFPSEEESYGFTNNANVMGVTPVLAEQYLAAAEQLAARAVTRPELFPVCNVGARGEAACGRAFIEKFGMRAFRRPLTVDEVNDFQLVFADGLAQTGDYGGGIRFVVAAMLQSPDFLYRIEFGEADPSANVVPLGGYELASRLSYLFWGSMPDDVLFEAAAAGELSTKEQIEAQARRMLKDPRAERMVAHFHNEWLGLGRVSGILKDVTVYPEFSTELRDDLMKETDAFLKEVFWRDGTLESFFSAPYTFVNDRLAALYGLPAPAGSGFVKVDTTSAHRLGFLTQGSFLALNAKANQPSPIHRGKFVREKLLCNLLPPPPNNIVIKPPEVKPGSTSRERFEQHTKDGTCRQCHQLMDPIGFGFENYDGVGKYRTEEAGKPVDATGEFIKTTDLDGPFVGVPELAKKLGTSEQVADCVVTQWFRFGYGRTETNEDACTMDRLRKSFAAAKHDVRELLIQLALTDSFRYRRPIVPVGGAL